MAAGGDSTRFVLLFLRNLWGAVFRERVLVMLLSPLTGIIVFLFFVAGALGIGSVFARPVRRELPDGLFLSAAFALGAGALSILFFILCSLHKLTFSNSWTVVLAGCALFVWNFGLIWGATAGIFRAGFGSGATGTAKICAAAGLVLVLAGAVSALAPPVEQDGLMYHLALPKIYAAAGGFVSTPSVVYSHFPLGAEMLFLFSMVSGSAVGAGLIHLAFGLFSAIAIWSLGSRLSNNSPNAAPLATLLFLSTPVILWEFGSYYVDLAMCLYLFVAFAFLILAPDSGKKILFVGLAGVCAGFAVGVKLTAGPYAILLAAMIPFIYPGRISGRLAAAALFCVLCAAPVMPWLARTFAETGNPVFPFFYSVLGGRNWNPGVNLDFLNWHFGYGAGRSFLSALKLPYNLTFQRGGNFGWNRIALDRGTGFAFLFLLPILFAPGRLLKRQGAIAVFTLLCVVAWFFGTQQVRFVLAFLPVMCLIYGAKSANLAAKFKDAGNYVILALIILLGVNVYLWGMRAAGMAGAIFGGPEAREKYIVANVPPYKAFRALDSLVLEGPAARVGLALESRMFYSPAQTVWLTPSQQGVVDYSSIADAAGLRERFDELGIRYLLVSEKTFVRLFRRIISDRNAGRPYSPYFYDFFTKFYYVLTGPGVEVVYRDGTFAIFKLSDPAVAPPGASWTRK
jgi:hypothetical protein